MLLPQGIASLPVLKGLKIDPQDPLHMQFIIDPGTNKTLDKDQASQLIHYFLAALATPQQDIWVNLSPYEKERIMEDNLSYTDLGKAMLEQDYLLKQLASSLTYPETETGKKYWDEINNVGARSPRPGQGNPAPTNSFNKVWISSREAEVYEGTNTVVITRSTLKALTDADYLAMQNNVGARSPRPGQGNPAPTDAFKKTILPKIEQELNTGKNFANLRQIYNAVILASWFKNKFKESFFKYYLDKKNINGIALSDKTSKEKIFDLYVEAFQKGAYNYIKKEMVGFGGHVPNSIELGTCPRKIIRRAYFSGGIAPNVGVPTILPVALSAAAVPAEDGDVLADVRPAYFVPAFTISPSREEIEVAVVTRNFEAYLKAFTQDTGRELHYTPQQFRAAVRKILAKDKEPGAETVYLGDLIRGLSEPVSLFQAMGAGGVPAFSTQSNAGEIVRLLGEGKSLSEIYAAVVEDALSNEKVTEHGSFDDLVNFPYFGPVAGSAQSVLDILRERLEEIRVQLPEIEKALREVAEARARHEAQLDQSWRESEVERWREGGSLEGSLGNDHLWATAISGYARALDYSKPRVNVDPAQEAREFFDEFTKPLTDAIQALEKAQARYGHIDQELKGMHPELSTLSMQDRAEVIWWIMMAQRAFYEGKAGGPASTMAKIYSETMLGARIPAVKNIAGLLFVGQTGGRAAVQANDNNREIEQVIEERKTFFSNTMPKLSSINPFSLMDMGTLLDAVELIEEATYGGASAETIGRELATGYAKEVLGERFPDVGEDDIEQTVALVQDCQSNLNTTARRIAGRFASLTPLLEELYPDFERLLKGAPILKGRKMPKTMVLNQLKTFIIALAAGRSLSQTRDVLKVLRGDIDVGDIPADATQVFLKMQTMIKEIMPNLILSHDDSADGERFGGFDQEEIAYIAAQIRNLLGKQSQGLVFDQAQLDRAAERILELRADNLDLPNISVGISDIIPGAGEIPLNIGMNGIPIYALNRGKNLAKPDDGASDATSTEGGVAWQSVDVAAKGSGKFYFTRIPGQAEIKQVFDNVNFTVVVLNQNQSLREFAGLTK